MSFDIGPAESWQDAFAAMLEKRTGITLSEAQMARAIPEQVTQRIRALGLKEATQYIALLSRLPISDTEWAHVIKQFTVGETWFFRDPEQFDTVVLLLREAAKNQPTRPLNIWSAACATGDEAWTLAILCAEQGISAEVLGTDINEVFVQRAQEGVYREWHLRKVDKLRRMRWFERTPTGYRLRDAVRSFVRFNTHNLIDERPPRSNSTDGKWDLVLCRNVFLYFSRSSIHSVCHKLARVIRPGGALVTGVAELLHGLDLPFVNESVGRRVAYRLKQKLDPARRAQRTQSSSLTSSKMESGQDATMSLLETCIGCSSSSSVPVHALSEGTPRSVKTLGTSMGSSAKGSSSPEHQDRLKTAIDLATAEKLQAATELLEDHLKNEPNLIPFLALGHLRLRAHSFDEAVDAFRQAVELDPLLAEAHYFEGLSHRKAGRWEEAEKAFRRALFLAPNLWQAAFLLSGTYRRLGRHREARRELNWTHQALQGSQPCFRFRSPPELLAWFDLDIEQVRTVIANADL